MDVNTENECIIMREQALKLMRAGNAGSGPLIRRRRREVALMVNILEKPK